MHAYNPDGLHAGDLTNLFVGDDGTATVEYLNAGMTLSAGPASLFDRDGSSIIVHALADDDGSDPAGQSGERVACAVIVRNG
jgi:superoxide dismutase, Cu-Zn family